MWSGLKTLGHTLRNSQRELLLLTMTVSMCMLIMAGLAYALEKDEPDTMFYTLPQTLYWAIITMTSTGTVNTVTGSMFYCCDLLQATATFLLKRQRENWWPRSALSVEFSVQQTNERKTIKIFV